MSSWNHRVMAHEHKGELYFKVHEVHYDDNKVPQSYSERPIPVSGENIKTLRWVLGKMQDCLTEPVLWAGDRFPEVCVIRYMCKTCGRGKFIKPLPHNCIGGFRKRGLEWQMTYS